ncbi:uncharacterized protein ACBT44_022832 isoform 3-T4 [Syngnathus typhle]
MLGNSSVQCAVGGVASLALLSLLGLLCLRCKTKSKIHGEAQIYNPHTFQREGSRFAVMRSKTVTKANQMTPSINEDIYPENRSPLQCMKMNRCHRGSKIATPLRVITPTALANRQKTTREVEVLRLTKGPCRLPTQTPTIMKTLRSWRTMRASWRTVSR